MRMPGQGLGVTLSEPCALPGPGQLGSVGHTGAACICVGLCKAQLGVPLGWAETCLSPMEG